MKSFSEFLNESWKQNGIVLIQGKEVNGKKNLYMAHTEYKQEHARLRKTDEKAAPVQMVKLYPDIYIIKNENGELTFGKISYTQESLEKYLGMKSMTIALNSRKTPLHDKTLGEVSPGKVLLDNKEAILKILDDNKLN